MPDRGAVCSVSRQKRALVASIVGLTLLLAACTTPSRIDAVPLALTQEAEPAVAQVEYYPGLDAKPLAQELFAAYARETAWRARSGLTGPLPPVAYLSVSGGGSDGAYGAGILNGWTEAGDRPQFKVVTGVSTGALIAPFAFLGPRYDPVLREAFTNVSDKDIYRKRPMTAALFEDAMADTRPMAKLVEHYVTRQLLDEIAAEYDKGRLLFIGTTDLDSFEPVVWNMGAIASSQAPSALVLFREVIMASAAIPGLFPPVMISVEAGGRQYQQLHVDGGATRQVFLYPPTIHVAEVSRQQGIERQRTLYIIRNSRMDPEWAKVDRRTLTIVGRAVSSLIKTQGLGDLTHIYLTATRDGIDYNLAYVPADFTQRPKSAFDTAYMRGLYEAGRSEAAHGAEWKKHPPGYDPNEAIEVPEEAVDVR